MPPEEEGGVGDDGVEVEVGRQLGEGEVQHVGLVVGEELVAAAGDDVGEDVDAEDLLAREEGVEEARDVAVAPDVVGEHGEGVGEGEVRLVAREVPAELRVHGPQDVGDQAQLHDGGRQRGEHEVPDPEHGEPGDGQRPERGREHEEENLADVVVALEVAQVGLLAEDLGDEVRELGLLLLELGLGVVWARKKLVICVLYKGRKT